MDKSKPPGISFDEVVLLNASVELPEERPEVDIVFAFDFDVSNSLEEEGKRLKQTFEFKVFARTRAGDPIPGLLVEFTLLGIFSVVEASANLALEKFARTQAAALIVPFAREFLYSIMMRSRWRDVLMPPVNVIAFLKGKEEMRRNAEPSGTETETTNSNKSDG